MLSGSLLMKSVNEIIIAHFQKNCNDFKIKNNRTLYISVRVWYNQNGIQHILNVRKERNMMSDIAEKIYGIEGLWKAGGCTEQQLLEAQQALCLTFPPEYADYLREFGCIDFFATEWTGLNIDGECNVVKATQREREINASFPENMFVLENAGIDGIIIAADEGGIVYQVQYEICKKICNSISGYLERCIARRS